jgi:hypothetical protein
MVFSANQDWEAYCEELRRGTMIRWNDNYEQRRPEPNAVEIVFVSRLPSCATTSSSSNNDNDFDNNTPAQKSEPHHYCHHDDVKDEEDEDDCAYSDATSVSSVTLASTFDDEEDEDDIVTLIENGMINNNKRGGFFASLTLEEEEEETTMFTLPPPPRQPQHLLVSDTDVPLWFSSSNHDTSPSMMIVWNLNSSDHSLVDVDNNININNNNNIISNKDHRPTTTGAAVIRQQLLQSSSPVVARIWIRRGDAYAAKHWFRQAQLAYQHAIDVLTDNDLEDGSALAHEAYAGLERVHQALGDLDRAEKYRVLANDDALRGAATAAAMTTGGGSSQRWRSLANDDSLSDLFRRATTID